MSAAFRRLAASAVFPELERGVAAMASPNARAESRAGQDIPASYQCELTMPGKFDIGDRDALGIVEDRRDHLRIAERGPVAFLHDLVLAIVDAVRDVCQEDDREVHRGVGRFVGRCGDRHGSSGQAARSRAAFGRIGRSSSQERRG
jgi:hypothetical protein